MSDRLEIKDESGKVRGYLTDPKNGWYSVYLANGRFIGAGKGIGSATEMIHENSGMLYEQLPAVKRNELTISYGVQQRIVGFQGGGYYQNDEVLYQGRCIGRICTKKQPTRRINRTMSEVGDASVSGYNLKWICQQNGLRLVE